MAENLPLSNSPLCHHESPPLSLSSPPFSQLNSSTVHLGPTQTLQQSQSSPPQSPKQPNFAQVSSFKSTESSNLDGEDAMFEGALRKLDVGFVKNDVFDENFQVVSSNSSEKLNLEVKNAIFECELKKLDVGFVQNDVVDENFQVGSSNSSENLNFEGRDTNFQCEPQNLDVGFAQNDVIDEILEVDSSNSSENMNLEGQDTTFQCDMQNLDVGFDNKGKDFDGLVQNASNAEDLTSSLMIDVNNDTDVVDVLKVEGKRNRKRGKKGGSLKNGGFIGVCESNMGKRKCVYSRKELEKLRYVNVKAQKMFWQEIYDGFSTISRKEYDELGSFRHKKHKGSMSAGGNKNCNDGGNLESACDFDNGHNIDDNVGDFVEEWIEDEESDDEYENIQRPAFKVDGEPDFESGPPEDGLEYLRRVRWEAKQIPKVKVVKLNNIKVKDQSVYMPVIPDIEECPPHLAPLRTWEDEFIADFSNLRLALSRIEDSNQAESVESEIVVFARQDPKSHPSKNFASLELTSGEPLISTVLAMDPATRVAMLRKRISLFETSSDLSKNECGWLFALCAVIETPLDADTCASLRCLLRRCAKLRAEKTEVDDEVAMLNVLATISGRYFGQLEI